MIDSRIKSIKIDLIEKIEIGNQKEKDIKKVGIEN
jgi:hypothetical protein